MPAGRATVVHLPEMALTLVRRVTARLPYNHFLFRAAPSVTKAEVREYVDKVYGVTAARITTSLSLGKTRRAPGRRSTYKLADYKRVLVVVADAASAAPPSAPAAGGGAAGAAAAAAAPAAARMR